MLVWPGFGVTWFGAGGDPNANLAFLGFSHQRQQYELSQLIPLAVIVVIGIIFYFLGTSTREQVVEEPIAAAYATAGDAAEPAS